jgi:hypothetical protein
MAKTDFIVNFIRKVISEEKEKDSSEPKHKGKKYGKNDIIVGYGPGKGSGGRFLGSVNEAGALARDAPRELMKNLSVAAGGSGLTGVEKILKAAISKTDAMNQAFNGISKISKGERSAISITPGQINARNGANLLHHVLIGAQGAGMLRTPEAVQIQVAGSKIIVHVSPYKNSWVN